MRVSRFCGAFLATVALVCLFWVGQALLVDPHGSFGLGWVPTLDFDARSTKMELFSTFAHDHSVTGLVLGSSHAFELNPAQLDEAVGGPFFNFSVEAAAAEDYLAIYRWVRSQGVHPREVIIGLDVEALYDGSGEDSRLEKNFTLLRALGTPPTPAYYVRYAVSRIHGEFNTSYASAEVEALDAAAEHKTAIYAVAPDGFIHYPRWEAQQARGEPYDLQTQLDSCIDQLTPHFKASYGLSKARTDDLKTLVSEITADNGRVLLWMTPLHPTAVSFFDQHTAYPRLLAETQTFAADLPQPGKVSYVDLTDTAAYGATTTDWLDCAHMNVNNAARAVGYLAQRQP